MEGTGPIRTDTIRSYRYVKMHYVGVRVIFMYEDAHAHNARECVEYYYLLRWSTVTGDEMPLVDIDTSDTHFRSTFLAYNQRCSYQTYAHVTIYYILYVTYDTLIMPLGRFFTIRHRSNDFYFPFYSTTKWGERERYDIRPGIKYHVD